jgi:hypothetical protein
MKNRPKTHQNTKVFLKDSDRHADRHMTDYECRYIQIIQKTIETCPSETRNRDVSKTSKEVHGWDGGWRKSQKKEGGREDKPAWSAALDNRQHVIESSWMHNSPSWSGTQSLNVIGLKTNEYTYK